jgi:hypothetical protein
MFVHLVGAKQMKLKWYAWPAALSGAGMSGYKDAAVLLALPLSSCVETLSSDEGGLVAAMFEA